MSNVPILILAFNRPKHTQILLERLRQIRPSYLFISCDGPRKTVPADEEKTRAVRALFKTIDWPCVIHWNFSDENLGCRAGVISGIDWFFSRVEKGIILEDDCIPDPVFFTFAEQMLEKYRNNTKVMHISGHNAAPKIFAKNAYGFSRMPQIWVWATWRRAWQLNDRQMASFSKENKRKALETLSALPPVQQYIGEKFEQTKAGKINTWDYIWFYSILLHNGVCITPNFPLAENVGFDQEGTHTFSKKNHAKPSKNTANQLDFLQKEIPITVFPLKEIRLFAAVQKPLIGLLFRYFVPIEQLKAWDAERKAQNKVKIHEKVEN